MAQSEYELVPSPPEGKQPIRRNATTARRDLGTSFTQPQQQWSQQQGNSYASQPQQYYAPRKPTANVDGSVQYTTPVAINPSGQQISMNPLNQTINRQSQNLQMNLPSVDESTTNLTGQGFTTPRGNIPQTYNTSSKNPMSNVNETRGKNSSIVMKKNMGLTTKTPVKVYSSKGNTIYFPEKDESILSKLFGETVFTKHKHIYDNNDENDSEDIFDFMREPEVRFNTYIGFASMIMGVVALYTSCTDDPFTRRTILYLSIPPTFLVSSVAFVIFKKVDSSSRYSNSLFLINSINYIILIVMTVIIINRLNKEACEQQTLGLEWEVYSSQTSTPETLENNGWKNLSGKQVDDTTTLSQFLKESNYKLTKRQWNDIQLCEIHENCFVVVEDRIYVPTKPKDD